MVFPKRIQIATAALIAVGTCTALASWAVGPAIVTPTAELLSGATFAYGNVVFGRKSPDGKLMLSLFLDHQEHLGTPGVYTFPVERFSGGENIAVTQFTRRYKWEMTPNPEVAKWRAVAGEAVLTVKYDRLPNDGYIGSLLLKDLVLQRVGSEERCKLETFSIDDRELGWTPRGCGGGFPEHAD